MRRSRHVLMVALWFAGGSVRMRGWSVNLAVLAGAVKARGHYRNLHVVFQCIATLDAG